MELQDAIGQRLDYFQELEHATRMLNHPGDSLVLQTDFLYMVERVDVCIDFLKAHVRPSFSSFLLFLTYRPHWLQRHFREAELYLLRFQQCMTRAMTLIKMFFVGSLRALTQDITRRLSEKVRSTSSPRSLHTDDPYFPRVTGRLLDSTTTPPLYPLPVRIPSVGSTPLGTRETSCITSGSVGCAVAGTYLFPPFTSIPTPSSSITLLMPLDVRCALCAPPSLFFEFMCTSKGECTITEATLSI